MAIRPETAAIFEPLGEGGMILNADTGDYYQVNRIGRFIWETMGDGCTSEDLGAALVAKYEIDLTKALQDVATFVDALVERSLVTSD